MSNEIITKLRAPFPADRIEWRLQSSGEKQDGSIWAKCLCYIDNRAAMERLDDVYGMNWSHSEEFKQIGNQAVCTVTITIESKMETSAEGPVVLFPYRSVTGSCSVEANGDIDPFKSAASGAMKRAVVNLGVGRYLYDLPEAWAVIDPKGKYEGKTKNQTRFRWNPPQLPAWAGGGNASPQSVGYAVEDFVESTANVRKNAENSHVQSTQAAPAPVESDGTWRTVVVPFGKQKGQTLGQLPPASLKWWRENYQPKPYNGKISLKDKAFRDALDQSSEAYKPMPGLPTASKDEVIIDEAPSDDVPF
jgi:hypothetical protein